MKPGRPVMRQCGSPLLCILNDFDELVAQYGDVMPRDKRALVEEIRKSPFMHHLAAIREIAAEA